MPGKPFPMIAPGPVLVEYESPLLTFSRPDGSALSFNDRSPAWGGIRATFLRYVERDGLAAAVARLSRVAETMGETWGPMYKPGAMPRLFAEAPGGEHIRAQLDYIEAERERMKAAARLPEIDKPGAPVDREAAEQWRALGLHPLTPAEIAARVAELDDMESRAPVTHGPGSRNVETARQLAEAS